MNNTQEGQERRDVFSSLRERFRQALQRSHGRLMRRMREYFARTRQEAWRYVKRKKFWIIPAAIGTLIFTREMLEQRVSPGGSKIETKKEGNTLPSRSEWEGDILKIDIPDLPDVPTQEPDYSNEDTLKVKIEYLYSIYLPGAEDNKYIRRRMEATLWGLGIATKGELQALDATTLRRTIDGIAEHLTEAGQRRVSELVEFGKDGRPQDHVRGWKKLIDDYIKAEPTSTGMLPSPQSKLEKKVSVPEKPELEKKPELKPAPEKKLPPPKKQTTKKPLEKQSSQKEAPPLDIWVGIVKPSGMGWEKLYKRVEESMTIGKQLSKEENKELAAWKQYFDKILGTIKKKETGDAMSFHDVEVLGGISDPVLQEEGFRIIESTVEDLLKNPNLHTNAREGYSNLLVWLQSLH